MKYLILGPASMGIFALIGGLKARESQLVDVQEISGSSAGAILTLFLAMGMSVDEILEIALSINISNFFKIKLSSFFSKFGFVDMAPIKKKPQIAQAYGKNWSYKFIARKVRTRIVKKHLLIWPIITMQSCGPCQMQLSCLTLS